MLHEVAFMAQTAHAGSCLTRWPHLLGHGLQWAALRGDLRCERHEARAAVALLIAAAVLLVHQVHQLPQVPLIIPLTLILQVAA